MNGRGRTQWLAVGLLGVAAVGVWVVLALHTREPGHDRLPATAAVDESAPSSLPAVASAPPTITRPAADMRTRIRAAVEQASQSVKPEALPDYLEEILSRARAQGRITALESEVAMDLIARFGGGPEVQLSFVNRLNALARDLSGERSEPPRTRLQIEQEIHAIGDRLETESQLSPAERQALVSHYIRNASGLDPEDRIEAMRRLNEVASTSGPGEPSPRNLGDLWATVERTRGTEQEQAIRQLIQSVSRLSPEEQVQHMQRLNALRSDPARSR